MIKNKILREALSEFLEKWDKSDKENEVAVDNIKKMRGAVKLGSADDAFAEAFNSEMSKIGKIDSIQKLDRKEVINVNLKNILKEFPLETELEQGQKIYIGIRDNEIVLEFWEMVQNFEETDWENTNTYRLKLQ